MAEQKPVVGIGTVLDFNGHAMTVVGIGTTFDAFLGKRVPRIVVEYQGRTFDVGHTAVEVALTER
jgi:hypothetical protein